MFLEQKFKHARQTVSTTKAFQTVQFRFRKYKLTKQATPLPKVLTNTFECEGTGQLHNRKNCALVSLELANAFNLGKPLAKIDSASIQKEILTYLVKILRSCFTIKSIMT